MLIRCPECDTVYDIEKRLLKDGGRNLKCTNCAHHWFEPTPALMAAHLSGTSGYTGKEPRYLDPSLDDPDLAQSINLLRTSKITDNNLTTEPLKVDGFSRRPSHSKGAASFARKAEPKAIPSRQVKSSPSLFSAKHGMSVIGAAKVKAKENWVAMIGLALVAISFSTVFGMRDAFGRAFPDLVSLYAKAGLDVNVVGVDIVGVETQVVGGSGSLALNVSGQLVNVSGSDEAIPPLQVTLMNEAGESVYNWAFAADANRIDGEQVVAFETTLVDAPPDAVNIRINFIDEKI